MAFTEFNIESNDGNVIHISSTNRDEFIVKIGEEPPVSPIDPPTDITRNEYHYYYDVGIGQPSSVLNIPMNLPISTVTIDDIFNHYSDPKSSEYYSSDEYVAKKTIFDSCAYWVWGSYDLGGMVALRTGDDNVQISIINGFYQIGENAYCYNTGTKNISIAQSQNIILTCLEGADPNTGLQFMIGTGQVNVWLYQPIKNEIGNIKYYETIDSYSDVVPSTWADYSQYVGITKQKTQPDNPTYLWGGNTPNYTWATSYPIFPFTEKISGTWDGNSEVDDEGNPFLPGDVTLPGGGWGDYPSRSDSIPTTNPENFSVDVITSGILTLYKPTPAQINQFQNFLFGGITDSIANQLKKLTSDPLQYLLFVAMVHYSPEGNDGQEIAYAGIGTGVYSTKINKQYKQIDCGTITIPEASKSFLDYGSYSKVSIYLPYVGVEHLNIDDVMGADVHVVYNINQLDGSCVVQIECNRTKRIHADTPISSVLYHFNGNCFTTIPMFATDWRGAISSAVSLIGGVGSIATGNVAGAVGALASAVSQEKVTLKRSSSNASNYGYMDNQHPYLILERPITNVPLNFGKYEGYTSNMTMKIANLRGYTEIDTDDIFIDYFNGITEEEFEELKDILNGGIYL